MTNDRTPNSGNPAQGPHPDVANPTPDHGVGNEFPDGPTPVSEKRPQDQPDLDAFAARMGTDRLGDDDSPADSAERSLDWRAPVSSALSGLSSGAKTAARKLQSISERITDTDSDADDVSLDLVALRERVDGVRTTMVTTVDERGSLGSRPLTVQRVTDEGDVLFVVARDADWVLSTIDSINVAFVDPDSTWVSVAGRAEIVDDPALLDDLWSGALDAFFPDGRDGAAILRVDADRWEYWAAPGKLAQLVKIAAARLGDDQPDLGSSGTIET